MGKDDKTGRVCMGTGSARGMLKFSTETVALPDLRLVSMVIHKAMLDLYKLGLRREIPPIWERPDGWTAQ
jgi:hypothetical protein